MANQRIPKYRIKQHVQFWLVIIWQPTFRPIEMDDPGSVRLLLLDCLGWTLPWCRWCVLDLFTSVGRVKARRLGSNKMIPSQHIVSHVPAELWTLKWSFGHHKHFIKGPFIWEHGKMGSLQVGFNVRDVKNSKLNLNILMPSDEAPLDS